jgi:hypothetical protein
MTTLSLPAGSPELWRHNRAIISERVGWPPGAAATCDWLEVMHPGWRVSWCRENTIPQFQHPAGYVARRDAGGVAVCGPTLGEVRDRMVLAPEREQRGWLWEGRCCTPRPRPTVPPAYRR